MVGGVVIETAEIDGRVFVDCRDTTYTDTCAIFVEADDNSREVRIGDVVWWHGDKALWTPAEKRGVEGGRQGVDFDIVLKKLGRSGVRLDRSKIGISY